MATNTYVALDETTVFGTSTATITFASIPATYTDLVIVGNLGSETTNAFAYLQFNGDTASNYSNTELLGSGSAASSSRGSSLTQLFNSNVSVKQGAVNSTVIYQIMNYSNTTTYKTALARQGSNDAADYNGTNAQVGLWRNTAAITSVAIKLTRGGTGYNFSNGSTFSLYGIAAEGVSPTTKATGGAVYSDDVYYYHVFGATGAFVPTQSITADILTIAGGGSGGLQYAGGGGAGGLVFSSSASLVSGTSYTCTVGAGAAKAVDSGTRNGTQGSNSTFAGTAFSTITATGGGYGGGDNGNVSQAGGAGGSGGGGTAIGPGAGGTGSQGSNGGTGGGTSTYGGGGGGSGEAGNTDGNAFGGDGTSTYSSWGLATGVGEFSAGTYYIAGGGGGSINSAVVPAGGLGGGGNGGYISGGQISPTAGRENTGSGGGAGWGGANDGGKGGSGVVIVRYAK